MCYYIYTHVSNSRGSWGSFMAVEVFLLSCSWWGRGAGRPKKCEEHNQGWTTKLAAFFCFLTWGWLSQRNLLLSRTDDYGSNLTCEEN